MFRYPIIIKLHETDAAGLLFFSQQFKLMHDAYESLLERIGFGFAVLIRDKDYFLPIVHAEADFKYPLFVGDRVNIDVSVANIGDTSFTFAYKLTLEDETLVGSGKTVHVTMDKKTQTKISLPSDLRRAVSGQTDNS